MTLLEPLFAPDFLFLACLVSIGLVLVGEMFRDTSPKPPRAKELIIGSAIGGGLMLLAAHLMKAKSDWSFVAMVAGLIVLLALLYGVAWRPARRFRTFGLPLVIVLGFGVRYFNDAYQHELGERDKLRRAEAAAKAEEQEFVEKIRQARTFWTPGPGVQEFRVSDTVVGWLAVDPKLEVDAEYEASQGAKAKRLIPIRVVMLNNSYEDARLPRTPEGSVWRIEARNPADQVVGQWSVDVGLGDSVIGPAERREFQIPWDGRTAQGDLVAPGSYVVSLRPDAEGAAVSAKSTIAIADAGPIETVLQSDLERQIQSHNETMRMLGDNIRAGQMLDRMNSNMQMLRR